MNVSPAAHPGTEAWDRLSLFYGSDEISMKTGKGKQKSPMVCTRLRNACCRQKQMAGCVTQEESDCPVRVSEISQY